MTVMTDTRTGIDDRHTDERAKSAADAFAPLKVQTPRTSSWTREEGARYLVALDVDGTLVDHDGRMSRGVKDALRAVVAAGHHVVISTGRSMGATLPVIRQAHIDSGFAVCSNGGVTLRLDPELPEHYEVTDRVSFDPAHALEALASTLPTAKFALEGADGKFYSTERFQDASFGIEAVPVDLHELAQIPAVRLVVYSATDAPGDFADAIERAGLHGVAYSVGWSSWLDVAANGVSKASALEQIRQHLDVDPAHTVAMGDGRNDIEMLQWAARGVAMGQAPDEVAAVSREVTDSVYDDGAAAVLRSLL
ncbi:HAD family hydrolase [Kocuria salsicia]|uniref:Phosphatase n=2 Tax=Kocuria TaxID=57493 RepID=A0A7D7KYN0_KOCVA|nr:Putative phosphatase [Kocuria varians]